MISELVVFAVLCKAPRFYYYYKHTCKCIKGLVLCRSVQLEHISLYLKQKSAEDWRERWREMKEENRVRGRRGENWRMTRNNLVKATKPVTANSLSEVDWLELFRVGDQEDVIIGCFKAFEQTDAGEDSLVYKVTNTIFWCRKTRTLLCLCST